MKKWINTVKPPKFLRYLFFIAYSFYRRFTSERSDAHFTAGLFLSMIHVMIYMGVMMWGIKIMDKSYAISIVLFSLVQMHIWFLHKQKWELYIEEFKYVKRKQQLLGGIYLFSDLFVAFLLVSFPILLEVFFDVRIFDKK